MDSEHDKKKMNVEDDRLSSLPDDLIHKILSFNGLKHAIRTSSLSSRWRFIWTSLPCLDFSIQDFPTLLKFSQFVTHVLSHRNNLAQVYSIKLRFCGDFSQDFVKQLLNYAFSHNIQQLNVACLLEKKTEFPLSIFSSQTLKHLSLTREFVRWSGNRSTLMSTFAYSVTAISTLDLPALTTLHFHRITLRNDNDENTDKCVDFFSKCANLKNLTLESCKVEGLNGLSICHPLLSNLTLDGIEGSVEVFNVVTPQLKNLTIRNSFCNHRYMISAPELASLFYRGYYPLDLSTDGFHSLEKVDLCISTQSYANGLEIVYLFEHLQSVKFLTINLEIVELLSSYLELISRNPSPFANLMSLKIYPVEELSDYDDEDPEKVNMSIKVKNYLLNNSPNSTFTMVSREEIRDMKNTKLAQKDMAKLRVWLQQEKFKIETNQAYMESKKAPMESHKTITREQKKTQFEKLLEIDERMMQNEERIMQINGCWKDLSRQIEKGNEKTCHIISELHNIKEILIKLLPTSKRDEMQECFSSLCAEADIAVNKILDHLKIQCDMKRSNFSMHFDEIASTSQSTS